MIDRAHLIGTSSGSFYGPIRKPLKPEDSSERDARLDPIVILESEVVRSTGGRYIAIQPAADVIVRLRLIPPVMQQDRHHPVADQPIRRVGRTHSPVAEPLSERHRGIIVASAEATTPQAPEGPKLILRVVDALGESKSFCPQRISQPRTLELH